MFRPTAFNARRRWLVGAPGFFSIAFIMKRTTPGAQQGKRWKHEHSYRVWYQARVLGRTPGFGQFDLVGRDCKAVQEHLRHLANPNHQLAVNMLQFMNRYNGVDPSLQPQASANAVPHAPCEQDLNDEQLNSLQLATAGANLFLTGGAGTGKSFTLHAMLTALRASTAHPPSASRRRRESRQTRWTATPSTRCWASTSASRARSPARPQQCARH